jgi:hypothetical protein
MADFGYELFLASVSVPRLRRLRSLLEMLDRNHLGPLRVARVRDSTTTPSSDSTPG